MELIAPLDSLFLLGETREHPMHVAGLQLFEAPEGAGPEFIRELYAALIDCEDISDTFRRHPAEIFGGIANLAWSVDRDLDLEYHIRRSALPAPGRVRELLELTSRLHGTLLDRHRPLWESHLVEGLTDGRFAVYTKIHHALVDGVSAMRRMRMALATVLMGCAPAVGAAMVVGILVALFQALTQIQEATLTFVPKIIAVFVALMISGSFVGAQVYAFSEQTYQRIANALK